MGRTRASAKAAGRGLERQGADYLRDHVDDRIDRRVKTGSKDKGDLANVRTPSGGRVVVESKNTARPNLGVWAAETEVERINDDAIAGVILHKRHGRSAAGDQWVTCTLRDFAAILSGRRPKD